MVQREEVRKRVNKTGSNRWDYFLRMKTSSDDYRCSPHGGGLFSVSFLATSEYDLMVDLSTDWSVLGPLVTLPKLDEKLSRCIAKYIGI